MILRPLQVGNSGFWRTSRDGTVGLELTLEAIWIHTVEVDHEEARRLAVAEFANRLGSEPWRASDWQVSLPVEERVWGLHGPRTCLVFTFTRTGVSADQDVLPLRIAVDPDTRSADMLR